jgi:hypothetical protein
LSTYSEDPLSEPELVEHLAEHYLKNVDIGKLYQVKRLGKDLDEIYWQFGKIHGLENIRFLSDETLRSIGNPVALQQAINEVAGVRVAGTPEESAKDLHEALASYKAKVEAMGQMNPSDRKKLLSLPFYMSKRAELPEPRDGQDEMKLFEEITGMSWYDDAHNRIDPEEKITEFNYEQYLDPTCMESINAETPEFKDLIKALNFVSRTKLETLADKKQQFKEVMPLFATLTNEEKRAFVHML